MPLHLVIFLSQNYLYYHPQKVLLLHVSSIPNLEDNELDVQVADDF